MLTGIALSPAFVWAMVATVATVLREYGWHWHDLLPIVAEAAVAVVIYQEVENSGDSAFVERVWDIRPYNNRATIYAAFIQLCTEERLTHPASIGEIRYLAAKFQEAIWASDALRSESEAQLVYLSTLVYLSRNPRRYRLLIEWMSHTLILIWLTTGAYIVSRKAGRSDRWGVPLLRAMHGAASFAFHDRPLTLKGADGTIVEFSDRLVGDIKSWILEAIENPDKAREADGRATR